MFSFPGLTTPLSRFLVRGVSNFWSGHLDWGYLNLSNMKQTAVSLAILL